MSRVSKITSLFSPLSGSVNFCLILIISFIYIPSDCVRAVEGEGMHDYRHHNLKGNIYFVFDVTFPENGFLDEANLQVSVE